MAHNSWFAPDNNTVFTYGLTQTSAWVLLEGLTDRARDNHLGYLKGCEDSLTVHQTLREELQRLYAWFSAHCDYDGWQVSFDAAEELWGRPS